MKVCRRLIAITICISFSVHWSKAQEDLPGAFRTITATVLSEKDSLPISNVHVINLNTSRARVTDSRGKFSIDFGKIDILRISAIGYHTQFYRSNDSTPASKIKIFLHTRVYEADSVVIYPTYDSLDFKEAFLALRVEDTVPKINLRLPFPTGGRGEPGIPSPISNPFSYLYYKYSRKEQEKREYRALVNYDDYKAKINKRYFDLIKWVTGIEDEKKVESFAQFCGLEDEFIELSTDYDLINTIVACYERL